MRRPRANPLMKGMYRPQTSCDVLLEVTAEMLSGDAVAPTVQDSDTDSFITIRALRQVIVLYCSYKPEAAERNSATFELTMFVL